MHAYRGRRRPYWNESFQFAVPGDFNIVSFYVVELAGSKQKEVVVGKVGIPRSFFDGDQDLGDRWWPLKVHGLFRRVPAGSSTHSNLKRLWTMTRR